MSTFGSDANPRVTRSQGSYANPLATIATQDIPINIKQVFRLVRFYYCTDSLLHAIVDKMAEYPVTDIVIERPENEPADNGRADKKWKKITDVALNLKLTAVENNIDRTLYGVSFRYLYLPFIRYAKCQTCGTEVPLRHVQRATVHPRMSADTFSFDVTGTCRACNDEMRRFTIRDKASTATTGLKLIRLNPIRMELEYNPTSGDRVWYWTPPGEMRTQFMTGVRTIIETTEMKTLEAIYRQAKVRMNPERLWVDVRSGVPGVWEGWGFPPLFPVLEDVYYYKILRRANEALAHEHITPMRFMTPAAAGQASPQQTINLADWQVRMRAELNKFRRDPNHIVLTPIPVNVEQVGGQARVMMVAAEQEAAGRVIAAGVGCPLEMVMGGLNWSGGSISLRVLENHFLAEQGAGQRMLDFLAPRIARYYKLPQRALRYKKFKMADDPQQQANAVNLLLQGFLSREDVLPELGYDPDQTFNRLSGEHDKLNEITLRDNLAGAHMQTVVSALQAKAEILLKYELQIQQQIMQAAGERKRLQDLGTYVQRLHQQGYTSPLELDQSAQIMATLPPGLQQAILSNWSTTMPMVTQMLLQRSSGQAAGMAAVQGAMANAQGPDSYGAAEGPGLAPGAQGPYSGGQPAAAPGADAPDPLPEQLPPRRSGAV